MAMLFQALARSGLTASATRKIEYFDIVGKYHAGAWTLMAGVTNLTNEDPPYVPDVSANTSGIYDFMGSFYCARASVSCE